MTLYDKRTGGIHYAVPGLTSIGLLLIALVIPAVQLFSVSLVLGIVFSVSVPLFFIPVLYWYCRKCPYAADGTCRHVIFGRLTKALFTLKKPASYSAAEMLLSLAPLGLLVLFPQYWLFQSIGLAVTFWALMAASFVIVRIGVCPACGNRMCALCPKARRA